MITNDDRAHRFAELLPYYPDDEHTNLIDILTDAMHWCSANGVNFDDQFHTARMHFEAETTGGG